MTMIWDKLAVGTIAILFFIFLPAVHVCAAETAADWPQWRGPTRDGIAAPGPKLLDTWPKEGPPRVWKSDAIRGFHVDGGMSSVVVAEGKVLVYVHSRIADKPVKLITPELLKNWGWVEDMPEDLSAKIEKARTIASRNQNSEFRKEASIETFLATIDPAQAAKYDEAIRNRLRMRHGYIFPSSFRNPGTRWIPNWKDTVGFSKMLNKEYATLYECWEDINKYVGMGHKDDSWMFHMLMLEGFPAYDTVVCLDAATGKQVWRKDFPGGCKLQLGMQFWGAAATPAIAGGKCYVQGSAGFYCLSLKDGAVVWQSRSEFSNSSPMVTNGVAYAMTPWLTAFNAETGKILWLQERVAASWDSSSVIPWVNGGKTFLLALGQASAPACIEPETGKLVWETTKDKADGASTPVVVGDVMIGSCDAFKLTPQGGVRMWRLKQGGDRGASLTYFQEHVYSHSGGGPRCFDFKTGEQIWKSEAGHGGECYSAALADGKFFGGHGANGTQVMVMYKASPGKYEELGCFKLNVAYATSPAIAGGKLYVRLEDGVACYDIEKH